MSQNEHVQCPECGWNLPMELVKKLLETSSVYCEKCGMEIRRADFNEAELRDNLKTLLNTVRKGSSKLFSKLKKKIKDFRNK